MAVTSRMVETGSVNAGPVKRSLDRLDQFVRSKYDEFILTQAVQDNRLTDLESKNVVFFNSFSHTLTAATTRFFNNDSATGPSYDPRTTLSQQTGPPAWTRFTAPLTGIYTFHYRIVWSGLTASSTVVGVRTSRNGAAEETQWEELAARTTLAEVGSFPLRLTATDTIDWGVRTSTGSTMDAARVAIVLEGKI